MKSIFTLPTCLVLLLLTACNNQPSQPESTENIIVETTAAAETDSSLTLPTGFKAIVVVEDLPGRARHFAVNDNGDLYVHMPESHDGKGVAALRDTNSDGKADLVQYFGEPAGTGMGIHNGYLYLSDEQTVYRYTLIKDSLLPDLNSRVVVVGGFPKQNEHADKPFCFDNAGHIYVNVGAPSNACQKDNRSAGSPGMEPCPLLKSQAGIWQFDAAKTAQTQEKDGVRYATGLRNCMALDWNASTNSLYALQHGRDQLHEFWKNLYSEQANAELPAEEFFQVNQGDDFGWPYCYFDGAQNKKMLAPEYGGDGKKTGRCAQAKQPIVAFPAHIAPNDLAFYAAEKFPAKYRGGAFVAFHGSWNRAPLEQKGFLVAFVPMADGKVNGEWEVFAEGFSGGGSIKSPDDAKHRPTGLGVSPDGALYVSDSKKGKIWRIIYEGQVQ